MHARLLPLASLAALALLAGCASPTEDAGTDDGSEVTESEAALDNSGIIPQVSIAGVKLGMTIAQVRALHGEPHTIWEWAGDRGIATFRYRGFDVSFEPNVQRVYMVDVQTISIRTKEGVGVGTLRRAVDALPGTTCHNRKIIDPDMGEVGEWSAECQIGSGKAGTVGTLFVFRDEPRYDTNKVTHVKLVRWVD